MGKIFFISLLFFTLTSCQSKPVTLEVDYRKIFEASLKDSGNRILYKISDHPNSNGELTLTAKFATKKKSSFQIIELTVLKISSCTADTPSQDLKLNTHGVGPNGASSDLTFCAGDQALKLADFNHFGMSDTPHEVGLIHLAQLIQNKSTTAKPYEPQPQK